MVPAWVLLERKIYIEHDASASGGAGGAGEESMGGASAGGSGKKSMGGASAGGSGKELMGGAGGITWGQDITDAILDYLKSLKPDAHFANPPELSALRLLRPTESIPRLCGGITSAFIVSADKDLVALYAGPYRPGTNLKGGYLVYNASKNSLSTIPKPPHDYSRAELGLGAVVVAEEDTYRLCELTKMRKSDPPQAALCTWRPSSPEWKVKTGSLPPEMCPPNYFFRADMCFSYRGSILCWVDLFKGMVICDLMLETDGRPKFGFIPLPRECITYDRFERPCRPEEFRSIACVGGSIKFVSIEGYHQGPGYELSLIIWTLSKDLSGWNEGKEIRVRDIWASEAYLSLGLPNIFPWFPVLSMHEEDVVCLIVTHWNRADDGKVEYRNQYLLSIDMQHNKVSQRQINTEELTSQLFATDCSSYLQRLEDHQGRFKTRKVSASGQRVVL